MTRMKVAELTSGVGALVLGVGLGALFPQWWAPAAGVTALAGVIAHAFGMWDKHRLEGKVSAASEPWVTTLYSICWLLLPGAIAFLIVGR